jgi:KaiC/GvpD/RAD55 family RecA-like ATPase
MSYSRTSKKDLQSMIITPKEKVEEILTYPFKDYPERGITKKTCEKFGVRAGLSEIDGTTITAYYFPSSNPKGKIVGYMKQNLSKSKEEAGHWLAIGSVSVSNKLFGQDVVESNARKRNNLVLTEGQLDCMSVYQACVDDVKGSKFDGLEPFVCSIPLGTANAVEAVLHNEELVKSFDALTIFFDDDYCTPAEKQKGIMKGHEAREAVAGAMVGSGLSLMTVSPDAGLKDASDYLQANRSTDLAKLVSFGKRPFSAEKIVHASDITFEELISPQPRGVVVDCFPKLMNRLNGFRGGELTLFISPSGVGKTSVCSILANKFMSAGHKLGMIFLEEGNKETLQRLVALDLGVNFIKFKRNPLSVTSSEHIQESYNKIANHNMLSMLDHFGSLPVNDLMNKIKHMHLIDGCKYIVLDHISMVISGLASDNERKDLDVAMTNLAAFCASNDVHIIVISHINRTDSHQFLPPKGKEGEAFWVNVRKESARGSAALEQLSWNIIGLEPEVLPDFSRGRVRLKVLKTRFGDSLGIADVFTLDEDTWEVLLDVEPSSKY